MLSWLSPNLSNIPRSDELYAIGSGGISSISVFPFLTCCIEKSNSNKTLTDSSGKAISATELDVPWTRIRHFMNRATIDNVVEGSGSAGGAFFEWWVNQKLVADIRLCHFQFPWVAPMPTKTLSIY